MDKKRQTIDTYNKSARAFADKFNDLGVRVDDIEQAFALINKDNPRVLEIGCGNGRDAEEICKRTHEYLGIDVSEEMIVLAKQKVPRGRFEVADIETFEFPEHLDVIFAFASLIHVPRESLRAIFSRSLDALEHGGSFYVSMKYADEYEEITNEDEFGSRTYYLYSQDDLIDLTRGFIIHKNEMKDLQGTKWLEVLLQKPLNDKT